MRKWMLTSIMLFAFMLTACRSNKIQGVEEMDSGEVSVTFQVPEGMTLEEVLGCEIGSENIAYSTNVETGEEFNVY